MKNFKFFSQRKIAFVLFLVLSVTTLALPAFADSGFAAVVEPVVGLLNSLLTPILAVVGAVGAIYCVFLGIKYAKAEEVQEREKAKSHLKNAIIGFVLIFVLILGLRLLMPVMEKWVAEEGAKAAENAPLG